MRLTPETLAPFLKAEIESIPVNHHHPGLTPRQLRQAGERAFDKAWRANR